MRRRIRHTVLRAGLRVCLGGLCVLAVLACRVPVAHARGAGAAPGKVAPRGPTAADKIVTQEKRRQDALVEKEIKAAGRDVNAFLAGVGRVVERYRQAMLSQGSALSHYLYGRILFKLADFERQTSAKKTDRRKVDTSIAEMNAALGRDARLWQARFALAFIHGRTGELDRMEAVLAELLRSHGDRAEVMGLYAQLLLQRRRFKELKDVAEKLLRLNPENLGARELLAKAYMGMEDWPHAEQTVRSMIARGAQGRAVYLMLLDCLIGQKKFDEAERQVVAMIKREPKDVSLRLVYVNVLVARDNRKRAIEVMKQVTAAYPKNVGYLGRLADLYRNGKQLLQAESTLYKARVLCETGDERARAMKPYIMTNLALVLYRAKKYEATVQVIEEIDRDLDHKLPPQLLDFLQRSYGSLGQRDNLIATLKRLLPHLDTRPEDRKNLEAKIKLLESGEGGEGSETGALWARDRVAELIEDIASPEVQTRRDALFQYYEANLSFVDPIVYQRYDPRAEPDAECRLWVIKILSRFTVAEANPEIVHLATRYLALALEDPDQDVRRAASQGLQKIAAPAASIYLVPYLTTIRLDGTGLTKSSRKANEREYNAARLALRSLLGREDTPIGAPNWVAFEVAGANRTAWLAWYNSSEAVTARLRALEDFDTDEVFGPRWPLRYLLPDMVKEPVVIGRDAKGGVRKRRTTPPAVFLRAYRLLRRHVLLSKKRLPKAFAVDPWFPSFPIYTDTDLKAENVPAIRKALIGWWNGLLASGARPKRGKRKDPR